MGRQNLLHPDSAVVAVLARGCLAIDVFFVISGFVIAYSTRELNASAGQFIAPCVPIHSSRVGDGPRNEAHQTSRASICSARPAFPPRARLPARIPTQSGAVSRSKCCSIRCSPPQCWPRENGNVKSAQRRSSLSPASTTHSPEDQRLCRSRLSVRIRGRAFCSPKPSSTRRGSRELYHPITAANVSSSG